MRSHRQTRPPQVAVRRAPIRPPTDPLGDALPSLDARETANAGPRLLFCHYREPGHTYVLYDWVADAVLVWISCVRQGVRLDGYGGVSVLINVGRLVHILALGVFWSGFIKDGCSLPRPLSPPLHRITMSGSVALEYGFPSTHSANAVSVAVYGLLILKDPANTLQPTVRFGLEIMAYFYAVSIVFGRLYCGMHGFLDVIIGSILGAVISLGEFYYGPPLDEYMHTSSWIAPLIAGLVVVILVRIHPEPADDCPCFDDSVAFAGVVIGLEIGTWTYGKIPGDPWETHAHGHETVDVAPLGWAMNVARIVIGVLIVFLWRETMKPFLLKTLPSLFRLIENSPLSLPRRFFTSASEYKSVPPGTRMDNMFPSASDFPRMVESIRHPTTRGRSVSIGPQSAADVYETLAYRERRRRDSMNSNPSLRSKSSNVELASTKEEDGSGRALTSGAKSPLNRYEQQMGEVTESPTENGATAFPEYNEDEMDESKVFSQLVKPRVRYDVEVVTKLVVYAGKCPQNWHHIFHRVDC